MSNSGADSGEPRGITNLGSLPLLDDTLTRKLPSMTFEKYIKETNEGHAESVSESTSNSHHDNENEFGADFELNLNGGSPALSKFQNPFEETPNEKDNKKNNTHLNTRSNVDNSTIFKTPSKKETSTGKSTPASSNRSKFLNFWQATSTNAADEFRALKNKQLQEVGYGYDNFDTSNDGLVIDIRKNEDETGEETSLDDSSIRLNLIPTISRYIRKEATQDTVDPTQADGDVHEEVNRLIRDQISKHSLEDEDGEYLMKGFSNSQQYKYSSNDAVVDKEMSSEKTSNEVQIQTSPPGREEEQNMHMDNNKLVLKDTLDVTGSSPKNIEESSSKTTQTFSDIAPVLVEETSMGRKEFIIRDECEEARSDDKYSSNRFNEQALESFGRSSHFDHDKQMLLKETQVIDNFSQSIVIEEDEDDEEAEDFARGKYTVTMKKKSNEDDEDGERIKTGRNILNTFKIEEESQSQLQSQSQSQSQPRFRKASNPASAASQDLEADHIQIQGSQANSSFGIPDTQVLTLPETLRIEVETNSNPRAEAVLSHISSPVDMDLNIEHPRTENDNENENGNENETTDPEIPNTSAVSISKICLDVKDDAAQDRNQEHSKATSTPIVKNRRSLNVPIKGASTELRDGNTPQKVISKSRSNIMERLSNVLREENQDVDELVQRQLFQIERARKENIYDITDVLDCSCVFIMDSSSRIPGRITKMVQSDDVILVNVKVKDGEVIVDHSKIYAPICFSVGDPVKYAMDKRHNYVVTGLKKTHEPDEGRNAENPYGGVETIDGYDKILIRKNRKNTKEVFEEIEVDLEDLYLTAPISRNYRYKLFNDPDDFQKYVDYQMSQFAMFNAKKGNYMDGTGADDTLINLLPVSRNRSFMKSKNQGFFSNCLFVITGIHSVRNGSRGDSKSNTPRHQRDKSDIQQLVEFIRLQGGTVLQDSGFEEIIKFRVREKNKSKKGVGGSSGYALNISPRKAKKSGSEVNGTDGSKGEREFRNFQCLESHDGYYVTDFRSKNSMEVDEEAGRFEFACVLSTRHVRTLKYLQCLCLKWPIIHTEFVKNCMKNEWFLRNWENEWTKYLLISGESMFLNSSIGLDIFEFYGNWRKGQRLCEQVRLNRLFSGSDVIVVAEEYASFERRLASEAGTSSGRKRRKVAAGEEGGADDREGSSEMRSQPGSLSDEEMETAPRSVIDGPASEETLLWIFRQLGFDRAIIPKQGWSVRHVLDLDHGSSNSNGNGSGARRQQGMRGDETAQERPEEATRAPSAYRKYVYVKYGNDIERFCGALAKRGSSDTVCTVNWEWVVQRIICNDLWFPV